MAVITISRSFGSGGGEIADHVCRRLRYHFFDKRLMARVASSVGLTKEYLYDFSEDQHKVQGYLEQMKNWRNPRVVAQRKTLKEDDDNGVRVEVEELDEVSAIGMVQSTIKAAYQQNNVVILGRGGQRILQDKPGVVHVRLAAPRAHRITRVQSRYGIDEQEAQEMVNHRDLAAGDYLKRFYNLEVNDPLPYHMVLNTGKYSLDSVARIIAREVSYMNSTNDAGTA